MKIGICVYRSEHNMRTKEVLKNWNSQISFTVYAEIFEMQKEKYHCWIFMEYMRFTKYSYWVISIPTGQ